MYGGEVSQVAFPKFGSPEDLEQRLSLVPAGDLVRGLVFNSTLATVRNEAEAAALQRCLLAAGNASFMSFFSYPVRSLLRLFYTAAWELSGKHGGFEGAMRHVGARSAPEFLQSAVGRALLSLSAMNMKQLFGSIPVTYPLIYAHGECTVSWTGARSGRLLLTGNLLPAPFIEGAVLDVARAIKPRGLHLQVRRVALTENELTFSWE